MILILSAIVYKSEQLHIYHHRTTLKTLPFSESRRQHLWAFQRVEAAFGPLLQFETSISSKLFWTSISSRLCGSGLNTTWDSSRQPEIPLRRSRTSVSQWLQKQCKVLLCSYCCNQFRIYYLSQTRTPACRAPPRLMMCFVLHFPFRSGKL